MELEGTVSLPSPNPTAPIDLEQLATDVNEAVQWACLRYQNRISRDECNDLSQEIYFKLIKDNCRLLRLFKHQSSFKTWLQVIVNHYVDRYVSRRRETESVDEVDQWMLIFSPPQDGDIYAAEQRKLLIRALGRLNEEERLLYSLWFVVELDPIKIAAVLGTEVKVIYKRKQTLVLKIRRLVRKFHGHRRKNFTG
jgi:RNA polymerase sigma factor (sigma-70 family)